MAAAPGRRRSRVFIALLTAAASLGNYALGRPPGAGAVEAAAIGPRCSHAFGRGELLPEPSAGPRVVRIYALRQARAAPEPLRLGYVYVASNGATYYQAETSAVTDDERAAEISWLRAAGISRPLAVQYTHLAEIPAVPPVRDALPLARRLHIATVPCP